MVPSGFFQANAGALIEQVQQDSLRIKSNPQFEQFGKSVPTILPYRYDALVTMDETQALHPLHIQVKEKETAPDTYPWGV